MKTRSKALLLSLCAVLLVCTTIFGTLAYLTDTDEVRNTFVTGKVKISLDEANVDSDVIDGKVPDRDQSNDYHLLPGQTYQKDPTIHVDADSEDCWLFVKIVNEIAAIEGAPTVADQMKTIGWTLIDETNSIYAYKETVSGGNDVVVFNTFTIDGASVDNKKLAVYEGKNITVTAYAVQAVGFDAAAAAWVATYGAPTA